MPELPEVETVRRGLEPVLCGQTIARVEQNRPDLRFPFPENFTQRLGGTKVEALARRAKYLLAHLSSGEVLLMHLGMSGRFIIDHSGSDTNHPGAFAHDVGRKTDHDHAVFHLSDGARIIYNDPRRFGFMLLVDGDRLDQHDLLRSLGVEPLGNALNAAYLAQCCHNKRTPLKAALLDQRIIAGLGNIYVCEALYRARLSPRRMAGSLANKDATPTRRCERLVPHIRAVLEEAIEAGGSTLRDYSRPDGDLGYFQHAFAVYGQEGEPCKAPGCESKISRIVQSGRSTFYCPSCQR